MVSEAHVTEIKLMTRLSVGSPQVATRRKWFWLAVPLVLAGCGGSSSDDDTLDLPEEGTEAASVDDDVPSSSTPATTPSSPVSDDVEADAEEQQSGSAIPEPDELTDSTPETVEEEPSEDAPEVDDPDGSDPGGPGSEPAAPSPVVSGEDPEAETSEPPTNADGGPVDCQNELPCAWLSADGGVTILMSRLDGENVDGSSTPNRAGIRDGTFAT